MENENEIKNQEINETQENSEQEQSELDRINDKIFKYNGTSTY